MLASGLAVNEAFLFMNGGMPAAGRRALGLSLWRPDREADWLQSDQSEPALTYLPSRLWLIGLGHLGQAYLWGLGLLPYQEPADVALVLQDIDGITESTESTSILTDSAMIGQRKTRAMAAWAERRGFATALQERMFAADFERQPEEPAVALCGLDNAAGRRALDQVGFDFIVEAGLGRGHRDFRTMRLHVLPGRRAAADIWKQTSEGEKVEGQPAYAKLMEDGELDRCGMTLLASKAVGAPFVGSIAATLALSQVLRPLHGGAVYQLIDIDLLGLDQRLASRHPDDFGEFNPGIHDGGRRVQEPEKVVTQRRFAAVTRSYSRPRTCVRLQGLVQDGVEKAAAYFAAGGKILFQLFADRHQFVDLGDDAVLFGEGRESE